jgi:hypothetical protein
MGKVKAASHSTIHSGHLPVAAGRKISLHPFIGFKGIKEYDYSHVATSSPSLDRHNHAQPNRHCSEPEVERKGEFMTAQVRQTRRDKPRIINKRRKPKALRLVEGGKQHIWDTPEQHDSS